MTLHFKTGGTWQQVTRPYVRVGNVWKAVNEVWVKSGGTWQRSYEYDITPPDPPVLSLQLEDTTYWVDGKRLTGRHINVGVRSNGMVHDTDLAIIRVLARQPDGSGGFKAPSTQFGATYIRGPQDGWLDEPWSDFSYNGVNNSPLTKDSSVMKYKTFPRNADNDAQLAMGRYFFTAWAKDVNGNWSNPTASYIDVPKKGTPGSDVFVKETRFQANNAGTMSDSGFTAGELNQARGPKRGIWFYGNSITDTIGSQGTPTIQKAQILVHRKNDSGAATANVYLWWHNYAGQGNLPGDHSYVRNQITKIGTINKGETKWFNLPDSYFPHLEADDIKGFGLHNQDPNAAGPADADFSVVRSVTDNIRTGEIHVTWTEKP